jgi:hypothetical protein
MFAVRSPNVTRKTTNSIRTGLTQKKSLKPRSGHFEKKLITVLKSSNRIFTNPEN